MRKLLLASVSTCLLSVTPALAQTAVSNAAGTGIANSRSTAGALAVSGQGGGGGQGGQGGNVTINSSVPPVQTINSNSTVSGTTTSNINQNVSGSTTQHVVSSGTTSIKTNPAVFAPGLSAAGLETCLGSASGGVSVVGFGLTGGSSYPDEGCQARLDSRTLWAMGLKKAALARLCQREQIYRSMPDVCTQYLPVPVTPVGYPAPVAPLSVYASASTDIMLIDGKTGRERMCSNYNAAGQKCRQWADAPRPVKLAATSKHRVIAAKPAPAAMPSKEVAAAPATPATTEAKN